MLRKQAARDLVDGSPAETFDLPTITEGVLAITMSNSNDTSRSSSPPAQEAQKSRIVSGSLKDRIAKFNNPSAAPLVPTHAFGTAGPGTAASGSGGGRGLYGNRIPSLDPKSAGHVGYAGNRRVSDNAKGGLIGNRIPSSVSAKDISQFVGNKLTPGSTGSSIKDVSPKIREEEEGKLGESQEEKAITPTGSTTGPILEQPKPIITTSRGRSSSPSGSIDSSVISNEHSQPPDSQSPSTSRSSSPPTSLGIGGGTGLHDNLLSATLPDDYLGGGGQGGNGAMTPSSTMAEDGEEPDERSAPPTPVGNAQIQLPPPEYDLVPGNLKLAAVANSSNQNTIRASSGNTGQGSGGLGSIIGEKMQKSLSAISAPRSFAPSVTSSLASQYDPSSAGNEEKQMMQDVSNISTPTGTPKQAHKELGDGDIGSTKGDNGSVMGDMDEDNDRLDQGMEEPRVKLGGAKLRDDLNQEEGQGMVIDKDGEVTETKGEKSHRNDDTQRGLGEPKELNDSNKEAEKIVSGETQLNESHSRSTVKLNDEVYNPNDDDDLDDLKQGRLSRSGESKGNDQHFNAMTSIAAGALTSSLEPSITKGDTRKQGGRAGGQLEEVWNPDYVQSPSPDHPKAQESKNNDVDVREATPMPFKADAGPKDPEDEGFENEKKAQDKEEDKKAVSSKDQDGGGGESTRQAALEAKFVDRNLGSKQDFVNEAFSGNLEAYSSPDAESHSDGGKGILSAPQAVEHVGPDDISAGEKIGIGQNAVAEKKKSDVKSDTDIGNSLNHPSDPKGKKEEAEVLKYDKREGKTLEGQLKYLAESEKQGGDKLQPLKLEMDDDSALASFGSKGDKSATDMVEMGRQSTSNPVINDDEEIHNRLMEEKHVGDHNNDSNGNEEVKDLPDVPSGELKDSGMFETKSEEPILGELPDTKGKPMQVHIEPAPLSQAEIDPPTSTSTSSSKATSSALEDNRTEGSQTPIPPSFPEPPHNEIMEEESRPDSPIDPVGAIPSPRKGMDVKDESLAKEPITPNTPLDQNFLKSFPVVPDESHPRIEVHVSPHHTPAKKPSVSTSTPLQTSSTPNSTSNKDPDDIHFTEATRTSTKDASKVEKVDTSSSAMDSPERRNSSDSLDTGESGLSKTPSLDPEISPTAEATKSKRRLSSRRSPKSPALDHDEDPGDFQPGEGWAVVTK